MAGLQVTRDRVVSPPERFIRVSDDRLQEHFQAAFWPGHDEQLSALYQLLEGITGHDFTGLRRCLEGDFAYFSAAAMGDNYGLNAKGLHESRLADQERRFLRDFCGLMASAHYRLLGREEWAAAQAEEFLFTLPVTVDWEALDDFLLRRHWAEHARERAALPDLADRILIFHCGVDVAKMQGLYLWTKLELLISFYMLQPLWGALAWALGKVGLRAPSALPLAGVRLPGEHPAGAGQSHRSFQTIGHVANGAMRLKKAAATAMAPQGVVLQESSIQHDAAVIVEQRTLNRAFPNGRAVLRKLFRRVELQEACFTDIVVLYRRKADAAAAGGGGEKEIIKDVDPAVLGRNLHIKHFRGIPLADLEMVLPEKHIFVPPSVFIQLAVAVVAAVGGLFWSLWGAGEVSLGVLGSAVALLATRASQVYLQAQSERSEIEREMNKLLFERTAASQEAVLHTLTEEMSRQRVRELFVCYCVLALAGWPMSDEELDRRCERLLRKSFGPRIDFTAEQAIPALLSWGLVRRKDPPALPPAAAAVAAPAPTPAVPAAAAEQQEEGAGAGRGLAGKAGWGRLKRQVAPGARDAPPASSPASGSSSTPGEGSGSRAEARMLSRLSRGSKQAEAEQQHLGGLVAVPMQDALRLLDAVWDGIFDVPVSSSRSSFSIPVDQPPMHAPPPPAAMSERASSNSSRDNISAAVAESEQQEEEEQEGPISGRESSGSGASGAAQQAEQGQQEAEAEQPPEDALLPGRLLRSANQSSTTLAAASSPSALAAGSAAQGAGGSLGGAAWPAPAEADRQQEQQRQGEACLQGTCHSPSAASAPASASQLPLGAEAPTAAQQGQGDEDAGSSIRSSWPGGSTSRSPLQRSSRRGPQARWFEGGAWGLHKGFASAQQEEAEEEGGVWAEESREGLDASPDSSEAAGPAAAGAAAALAAAAGPAAGMPAFKNTTAPAADVQHGDTPSPAAVQPVAVQAAEASGMPKAEESLEEVLLHRPSATVEGSSAAAAQGRRMALPGRLRSLGSPTPAAAGAPAAAAARLPGAPWVHSSPGAAPTAGDALPSGNPAAAARHGPPHSPATQPRARFQDEQPPSQEAAGITASSGGCSRRPGSAPCLPRGGQAAAGQLQHAPAGAAERAQHAGRAPPPLQQCGGRQSCDCFTGRPLAGRRRSHGICLLLLLLLPAPPPPAVRQHGVCAAAHAAAAL